MRATPPPRLKPAAAALFALLALAAPAAAEVMTFDNLYTIDVPQGWVFHQEEPGYTMFVSPDQQAVFLITTGLSMPRHRDKTAARLQQYSSLRLGSPDRLATLMRVPAKRVAVTIIGDHPDRVKMYYSIEAVKGDKMREEWLAE